MTETLLPPNSEAPEKALDIAIAVRIEGIPVPIADILDPWKCPEPFLPWLAWQRSVDIWNPAWPVSVKRQVIASSLIVHRIKGTPGAIELGLAAMDFEASVIEWWEASAEAPLDKGRFRVEVDLFSRGMTEAEIATVFAAVGVYKNAKSHLDLLTVRIASKSAPRLSSAVAAGSEITILPVLPEDPEIMGAPCLAVASHYGTTITLTPFGAA
jgi:phage tail P2-like protein